MPEWWGDWLQSQYESHSPTLPFQNRGVSHSWREGKAEEDWKPSPPLEGQERWKEAGRKAREGGVPQHPAQKLADELKIQPAVSPPSPTGLMWFLK